MLKVVLVEDETVIRESIRDNVPWEEYGYKFVGEAQDGEMALSVIRQTRPDVLITDIKMPFLDGLSLSKIVSEEFPKTKIVIISGYDDFEYARTAIEIGVEQYLLKPITKMNLKKVLTELKEKIEANQLQEDYQTQFANEMHEYERYDRRRLFEKIFLGELSVMEIYDEAGKQGIELTATAYNLLFINVIDKENKTEEMIHFFLRNPQYVLFGWNVNTLGVLIMSDSQNIEATKRATDMVSMCCKPYENTVKWYAALGKNVERLSQLPECYQVANHHLAMRFLQPEQHILSSKTLSDFMPEDGSDTGINNVEPQKMDPEIIKDFLDKGISSEITDFVASYITSVKDALNSNMFRDYMVLNIRFAIHAYVESLGATREEHTKLMNNQSFDFHIKPEDMEKLCSPYARLEEGRNMKVEGTGLGLSITKNLLDKMGSELQVDSVYGEGSEFYFVLKQMLWGDGEIGEHFKDVSLLDEDMDTPEKYQAPDAKILVVDDIDMNLLVIKNLLKRVRIEPVLCTSGMEAVELCMKEKYDIVFMDAMMPQMNGEEALKEIRKSCDLNKDTPIIILTANAIVGAKDEYLSMGFSDYISKPVDGIKLEDMIQRYLPNELVKEPEHNTVMEEVCSKEIEDAISLIAMVSGIDVKSGIAAAGGKTTYVNVCENFCATGDEKIKIIEEYLGKEDYANYTIQVHALKSSARLIGANGLSEEALKLENAGKEDNVQLIKRKTGDLLDEYRGIVRILKKIMSDDTTPSEDNRPELSDKKLKRRLEDMAELLQAYDFASAKELFKDLKNYKLPKEFKETYSKMQTLFGDADSQGILIFIEQFNDKK